MSDIKYTFLLPAYKARYLEDRLESISNQTYHNFKVIISDDCFQEPLYDICKRFCLTIALHTEEMNTTLEE